MPRLTAKDYLRIHDRLRTLWLRDDTIFAELSAPDQWLLHDFFVPSRDMADLVLLMHREAVTAKRPSLPQQAGRALSRFWESTAQLGVRRVARAKASAGAQRVRQADRKFRVRVLAQAEVDPHKLARAFIWLAEQRSHSGPAQGSSDTDGQDRTRP